MTNVDFRGWQFRETRLDQLNPGKDYRISGIKITRTKPFFSESGSFFLDNMLVYTSSDIHFIATSKAINVYPNPVSPNAVLTVETEQGAVISLVTLQGVLVRQIQAESNISQLSMKGLVSGTYILLVKDKNGVRTVKVIVR